MYQICIYNYDKSIEDKILFMIENMLKDDIYFFSKNWEGGPHIQVITKNKLKLDILSKIKKQLKVLIAQTNTEPLYIQKLQNQYKMNLELLSDLESKKSIKSIREHGMVENRVYDFYVHSSEMTRLYLNERFNLNQLCMDTRKYFFKNNVSEEELFPLIFFRISNIYQQSGDNKGYFSFVSHVHGFFELCEKQNKPYSESIFEKMYQDKKAHFEYLNEVHNEIICSWTNHFSNFYEYCLSHMDELMDDTYKKGLETTIIELEKNFKNDFHQHFAQFAKQKNFMENEEATAYRFTINLLYLILPFFNISALKKQQYIYYAYREVERIKGNTWREELNIGYSSH